MMQILKFQTSNQNSPLNAPYVRSGQMAPYKNGGIANNVGCRNTTDIRNKQNGKNDVDDTPSGQVAEAILSQEIAQG